MAKYTLSIEEASRYFRIGEKKLLRLAEENPDSNWFIMNGNRLQIKRKQFEKVIDGLEVICRNQLTMGLGRSIIQIAYRVSFQRWKGA